MTPSAVTPNSDPRPSQKAQPYFCRKFDGQSRKSKQQNDYLPSSLSHDTRLQDIFKVFIKALSTCAHLHNPSP